MNYRNLIRDLINAKGAPGFEDEVLEVLEAYKNSYTMQSDNLKNAYYNLDQIDPSKPTLMLDSHTDEVAFMVKAIDERGLIHLQALGGWLPEHVSAQHYLVRNTEGIYYPGISTSKPIHFMSPEERAKKVTLADLKIDLGASSRKEVIEDFKIAVGQPIVPATEFHINERNQVMFGKGFDNRIGVAVSVAIMHEMKDYIHDLPYNLVAAFASQEEVGMRGAVITSKRVNPQMALVFEGTPSDDFTADEYTEQARLGQGPQLRYRDNSYIANEWMLSRFNKIAKENKLPLQHAVREGGSTNAGAIHLSNLGLPVATLGTPTRYAHTNYCFCSYKDFEDTVKISLAFIKSLGLEDFNQFQLQ
ncbi:M42 family metallopeptidase [Facklamia miroungae]|uniref:Putative aminopeptidase FrvX n=1 Tax=Facklamia miroungae TaxID=120956 RepID=A0A1G7PBN2_9LACT|nr:M20/M25/M40 family metallo-hydrolase [Facklamia miroungae]NKZ28651.1 M42 family metallopeptidase [Facklamia miroungae]SDF83634.1 Putative aminopeptidase FrvX [Facklamia miroungae]